VDCHATLVATYGDCEGRVMTVLRILFCLTFDGETANLRLLTGIR
jgi:hypothetical protein